MALLARVTPLVLPIDALLPPSPICSVPPLTAVLLEYVLTPVRTSKRRRTS